MRGVGLRFTRLQGSGFVRCALGLCFLQLIVPFARADLIKPKPWRLLVFDARFVGVVECEQAGLLTAEYRVVDSWKGPAVGSRFWVEHEPENWERTVPFSEIGERYYLLANPSDGLPHRGVRWALSGGETYWWRATGCALSSPYPFGRQSADLPTWGSPSTPFLPMMGAQSAEACRESVRTFLSLPDDVQEGIVLNEGYPRHELMAGSALGAVLDLVLRSGIQMDGGRDEAAWRVGICGGDRALEMLRSQAGIARFGSDSTRVDHPIAMILRRRGQAPWWSSDFFRDPTAPSDSLRAKHRSWLRAGLPARDRSATAS